MKVGSVEGKARHPIRSGIPLKTSQDLSCILACRACVCAVCMCVHLQRIASGEAPQLLQASWASHFGEWCRGVNWDRYGLSQLLDICRCVGPLGLSVVCRMLAEDYSGWSGGMPDLLLWRPDKGDAKLSEVKGPKDRLSEAQRAWMLALIDVDVRWDTIGGTPNSLLPPLCSPSSSLPVSLVSWAVSFPGVLDSHKPLLMPMRLTPPHILVLLLLLLCPPSGVRSCGFKCPRSTEAPAARGAGAQVSAA